MENRELYRIKINDKIITNISNDNRDDLVIELEDAKISFSAKHEQDCCEEVYADFSVVKYKIKDLMGRKIQQIIIKGIVEIGFLLCFDMGRDVWEKIFIPCYNYQNGYYSNDLELVIKINTVRTKININNFVENHIH